MLSPTTNVCKKPCPICVATVTPAKRAEAVLSGLIIFVGKLMKDGDKPDKIENRKDSEPQENKTR